MKKKIFLLLTSLLSIVIAQAQTPYKKELYVGPSFGVNYSSVSFAPRVSTKLLMGYSGGLSIRWNTENHLGLQAEVNYSQNGWDEDFSDLGENDFKYTRTINYLEVPLLTHIYFGGKRTRFFINLGPKVGYMLSENTTESLDGLNTDKGVYKQHTMAIRHKFGWGLCGGPGFELRTGIGTFSLEGRYYYALGDIFSNSKTDEEYFAKSSNQVLSVKLSYLFRIF